MRRVGVSRGNVQGRWGPDILSFCFGVCLLAKNHPMKRHLTKPLFCFLACVLAVMAADETDAEVATPLAEARFVVPPEKCIAHTPERSFIGPGTIRLENGDILMAAPWGRPPTNFEQLAAKFPLPPLYRSADGGRTWMNAGRLPIEWKLSGMISDGGVSFLRLADGRLAFVANRHVKEFHGGGVPVISFSWDDGATWSAAKMLIEPDDGYYVMNDRLIQLRSGRLIVPVSASGRSSPSPTPLEMKATGIELVPVPVSPSRQPAGFLAESVQDKPDHIGGEVGSQVGGGEPPRFEQCRVRDAECAELAVEAGGAIVPVDVGGITREPLVPRPVERVHVEDRRVLPRPFHVAVGLPERVVVFTVVPVIAFPHRQMEIDRRGDGGRHWKNCRMPVGDAKCPLASHPLADQGDAGRLHAKPLCDLGPYPLENKPFRREFLVEAGHDPVEPPGAASPRCDRRQPRRLDRVAKPSRFLEPRLVHPVEIDRCTAGLGPGWLEQLAGMAGDGDC